MLISTAAATARIREQVHQVDAQPYVGREYIGSAPKPGSAGYGQDVAGDGGPQAYLVMQPPRSVTRPHFHQTNQFQVFVGGSGRVGKRRADPVTVQYAGANTPYGPIVAEDDGVHYFTLRQEWDSGAKYLPAQRSLLVKGRQRQLIGVLADDDVPASGVTETALVPPAADGLCVVALGLAAGETATLPDAAAGGGQYHLVVAGALRRDDTLLEPLSLEFASPDQGTVPVTAGPDGLVLLLLRFPRKAEAGT